MPERDREQRDDDAEGRQDATTARAHAALPAIQPHRPCSRGASSTLTSPRSRVSLPRARPLHAVEGRGARPEAVYRGFEPPPPPCATALRYGTWRVRCHRSTCSCARRHAMRRTRCACARRARRWPSGARSGEHATAAALAPELRRRVRAALEPSLRPVLNATGVILHTNLGRAPLADAALEHVQAVAAGYSNLELDLATGGRGSRQDHVAALVCELTGAEAAICVNNCAAALVLALAALAGGREIVVSRGQLVEIGDGFRIPEIVQSAGARLREVGTTNRTRPADYTRALGAETGAILCVHPSNYRVLGFTGEVDVRELARIAHDASLPLVFDVGSGALLETAELAGEPLAREALRDGCDLVCFSGDKLLGGPQAGILAGSADAIAACRRHPLARALRIDKLSLAALEATLRIYRDPQRARAELPVLRAVLEPAEDVRARAEALCAAHRRQRRRDRRARRRRRAAAGRAAVVRRPARGRRRPARGAPARGRSGRPRARLRRRARAGLPHAQRRGRGSHQRACMTAARALTLGTAGHIDHGKTALVRALTGVDTDRLPEEQDARHLDRARLREPRAAVGPLALGRRRARARALRAHDDLGRDRHRSRAARRRLRRRRDAADARARRDPRAARRAHRRRGADQARPRRRRDAPSWRAPTSRSCSRGRRSQARAIVETSARTGAGLDELRAALDAAAASVEPRAGRRRDAPPGRPRVHAARASAPS